LTASILSAESHQSNRQFNCIENRVLRLLHAPASAANAPDSRRGEGPKAIRAEAGCATRGSSKGEQTQLRTRVGQLVDEAREIEIKLSVDGANDGLEERKANIERGKAKASARLQELSAEYSAELTRKYEAGGFVTEAGVNLENAYTDTRTSDAPAVEPHRQQALDGCMRTLERVQCDGTMSNRAATAMERAVRHSDPTGITARYLTAVGDPAYNSAFGKLLRYGDTAAMRMTTAEQTAMQRVTDVESQRAMMDGIGASGGFAIPIDIDPTILLTSTGALNPVRSLADVRQMTSSTLRLVSANTPAASYSPELAEVTDGSPTLVQPTVVAQKGVEFIPFSIEIDQDWGGLQQELLKLLADGRDILDATKFLSGTGTNEPQGLFSGANGLQTTQRTQTATSATTVIGDLYTLRQQLNGTRFWPNATFAASPTAWDIFYRYVAQASTTDPLPFTEGRGGPFLGTKKVEWSTMASGTTTTGQKTAIVADWSGYVIGDRIGSQVELIPHLFGASNRFPTGERGLYYFWRTGTAVSKPSAFVYLETK
jgi:HK97 family phage major capsid protein